ncbi:MAG: phosphate ABC transporter permease PstA [Anaerolineae bacterium]|nr:phosphate ABC transporter permease PstA [Anaerolineae bacterium]
MTRLAIVVVVSKVDPERLALDAVEADLLTAPNTISSEDDNDLVAGITADPNGIGFLGNAYYQQNRERLKLVAVDGRLPDAQTAVSGEYVLDRPLFLYTTAEIMAENQATNVFVNYLLTHINEEIEQVGYLPTNAEDLAFSQQNWIKANPDLGLTPGQWAAINPAGIVGTVSLAGSSTLFPLTQHMLAQFTADGYEGTFSNESLGTTAGLAAFCAGDVDIAAASRPIQSDEFELCRANGRFPQEFRIGTDALAIVANPQNDFLNDVTQAELQQIFMAETWADVNSAWSAEAIHRYVPGADSGTLDFFAEAMYDVELSALSSEDLARILAANITVGRGRALEREQRFFENALLFESPDIWNEVCAAPANTRPAGCTAPVRTQEDMVDLLMADVVKPDVVETYPLFESIFQRSQIQQHVADVYPNGDLQFRSWLTAKFISDPQSSTPELAGVRTAILGSLWVIGITILFSFPVGVGAAIYLEEYATDNRLNRILQTNINNLAGVPSIIYGMLGLAIFVRAMEALTSGAMFGLVADATTANGRTILSAGLTLGLLILPLLIINSQEALRAVPHSLRQAGLALGATKWQTTWHHVLPSALPGILTGTILAVSRALGETAPLVVVGASTFIALDPSGPFSKFTTLPIQIYQWTSRPQAEFRNIAAAAILVLLIMLLTLNATAVYLRNRYSVRA